jgi:hypothetical protein
LVVVATAELVDDVLVLVLVLLFDFDFDFVLVVLVVSVDDAGDGDVLVLVEVVFGVEEAGTGVVLELPVLSGVEIVALLFLDSEETYVEVLNVVGRVGDVGTTQPQSTHLLVVVSTLELELGAEDGRGVRVDERGVGDESVLGGAVDVVGSEHFHP